MQTIFSTKYSQNYLSIIPSKIQKFSTFFIFPMFIIAQILIIILSIQSQYIQYLKTPIPIISMGSCFSQGSEQQRYKWIELIKKQSSENILKYLQQCAEMKSLQRYKKYLQKFFLRYKNIERKHKIKQKDEKNKDEDEKDGDYGIYITQKMQYHTQKIREGAQFIIQIYNDLKFQIQQCKRRQTKVKQWQQIITHKRNQIKTSIQPQQKQSSSICMNQKSSSQIFEKIIQAIRLKEKQQITAQQRDDLINTKLRQMQNEYEQRIQELIKQIQEIKRQRDQKIEQKNELYLKIQRYQKLAKGFDFTSNVSSNNERQHQENSTMEFEGLVKSNNIKQTDNLQTPNAQKRVSFHSQMLKKFSDSKILYPDKKHLKAGKDYLTILQSIFEPITIYQTNLKFAYDNVRPNNMNNYIKNEKNLLFLAKLKNETIIGGFSSLGFKETTQNLIRNICFIFSIHPKGKYYKFQIAEQSTAKYSARLDKDFLKIGSNEIRITCGKNQGFSNINSSSSIFECIDKDKKVGVKEFLNTDSDKNDRYELQTYEIHQLEVDIPQSINEKIANVVQSFISEC